MIGLAWAWHLHPISWLVLLAAGSAYLVMVRRPGWTVARSRRALFLTGLAMLAVALTWPLADLAAHWSLLALVIQRLVLTMAVPPLLIAGVPHRAWVALTRPAAVDAVVRACSRPTVAVVIVTGVAVGTLTSHAVALQSSSVAVRGVIDLALLGAGFVLWTPVLDFLPGARRLSALGRAGYLIVQSILPSFLSVVWIFAHHPLYPAFDRRFAGMSPLLDQQLAGFAAKLGTIAVLWTVAFVLLSRAEHAADHAERSPLTWADVQRELERTERAERRVGAEPPREPPET